MFSLSKKCVQAVGTTWQNIVGDYPHEHTGYTQHLYPPAVVHNFVHSIRRVIQVFTTVLYTGKLNDFHPVQARLYAVSTEPTTITTNLINT